ncbi:hypothetical protein ACH3XW_28520 [Acanthocheilonema viteae]
MFSKIHEYRPIQKCKSSHPFDVKIFFGESLFKCSETYETCTVIFGSSPSTFSFLAHWKNQNRGVHEENQTS